MTSEFIADFSLGSRWFSVLETYGPRSFKTGSECFSVSFLQKDAQRRLRLVLSLVLGSSAEVAIRFCDVAEMQEANLRFRGKNKPTDVLSFPPGPFASAEVPILGDILICLPVCYRQAREARQSLSAEVERMMIHGVTHLLGYDHERSDMAWRVQTNLEKSLVRELVRALGKPSWCEVKAWKK
jgi:probable rRNA maturation factor